MTTETLHEVCPAQAAWDIVNGKWKPCIIHVLSQSTHRYNALKREVPGITPRMLTAQLRDLERNGIIARHHYPEIPARVEYELTPLGHTLMPLLNGLTGWWQDHEPDVSVARNRYDAAQDESLHG